VSRSRRAGLIVAGTAAALWLVVLVERRENSGAPRLAVPRRAAGVVTVIAIALLATVFVVAPADSLSPDLMVALLLSGIGAFLAAFALYLMPVDRA
jgi:peptidoglycan/LPS O-acetylase OafA/YrhL